MLKTEIIKASSTGGLKSKINDFFEKSKISRSKFVDIKLDITQNTNGSLNCMALIIYEE